ncbi:betaine/proline/choline family ABC transporter ATP-binding protein [Paenibacillus glycanilyticus]|uniref:betaine/proline/choline family ABC transporter ATP-binding protein n=1 Tax=Paenibacillus glycanilyticus TaxID=126569 RepID=UPI002040BEAB|nr:betaine/proline/choline family ABC transporter ATP-binding protein [Paenibacillus glycanilyticus]MCM3629085.1 betaine/proline/choline family ABC transporter ATP-binding protein [Paenibacillus glycanilyticus]
MIQFNNVVKKYKDGAPALKGINLEIKKGELVTLIGPSGCGKTTTMKMINRLVEPTSGSIRIDGQDISKINPIELRRNIGYVIQNIGLFPHMKIKDNVEIVPRLKKMDKNAYQSRTNELMDLVGLDPSLYKNRYPAELSGGQQQRIGVIRAMAAEPSIILMDEPFSALDPISREQLQDELIRLQEEVRKTIVFVSHDMDEALKIADRIVLMQEGEIIQADTPEYIINRPKNDFVRTFIGEDRLKQPAKLLVEHVMLSNPVTVDPTRELVHGLELMRNHDVNRLLVIDNDRIIKGMVTKEMLEEQFRHEELVIQDIMNTKVVSVPVGTDIAEAVEMMEQHDIQNLPVINCDGKLTGLVTNSSLITALLKQQ